MPLPAAAGEYQFGPLARQIKDAAVAGKVLLGICVGSLDSMARVLKEGKADAVLATSIFHYGEYTIKDVKDYLAENQIPVRR